MKTDNEVSFLNRIVNSIPMKIVAGATMASLLMPFGTNIKKIGQFFNNAYAQELPIDDVMDETSFADGEEEADSEVADAKPNIDSLVKVWNTEISNEMALQDDLFRTQYAVMLNRHRTDKVKADKLGELKDSLDNTKYSGKTFYKGLLGDKKTITLIQTIANELKYELLVTGVYDQATKTVVYNIQKDGGADPDNKFGGETKKQTIGLMDKKIDGIIKGIEKERTETFDKDYADKEVMRAHKYVSAAASITQPEAQKKLLDLALGFAGDALDHCKDDKNIETFKEKIILYRGDLSKLEEDVQKGEIALYDEKPAEKPKEEFKRISSVVSKRKEEGYGKVIVRELTNREARLKHQEIKIGDKKLNTILNETAYTLPHTYKFNVPDSLMTDTINFIHSFENEGGDSTIMYSAKAFFPMEEKPEPVEPTEPDHKPSRKAVEGTYTMGPFVLNKSSPISFSTESSVKANGVGKGNGETAVYKPPFVDPNNPNYKETDEYVLRNFKFAAEGVWNVNDVFWLGADLKLGIETLLQKNLTEGYDMFDKSERSTKLKAGLGVDLFDRTFSMGANAGYFGRSSTTEDFNIVPKEIEEYLNNGSIWGLYFALQPKTGTQADNGIRASVDIEKYKGTKFNEEFGRGQGSRREGQIVQADIMGLEFDKAFVRPNVKLDYLYEEDKKDGTHTEELNMAIGAQWGIGKLIGLMFPGANNKHLSGLYLFGYGNVDDIKGNNRIEKGVGDRQAEFGIFYQNKF